MVGLRHLLLAAVLIAVCFLAIAVAGCTGSTAATPTLADPAAPSSNNDPVFAQAFAEHARGLPVEGLGTVSKLLSDDENAARHQRFIVELDSGQTLLVAHNIDLAPQVEDLHVGDTVEFKGQYEWNEQGGIVHWTHHDPDHSHEPGWIRHNGRTYQ